MFPPEPLPEPPLSLAQAIARMEGWYIRGEVPNRPQRNNNPGDINYGLFAAKFDAVLETVQSGTARFAKFPTPQQGWAALEALLRTASYSTSTIRAAVNKYAPPVENNTDLYVNLVCQWVQCNADQLVSEVLQDASPQTNPNDGEPTSA